MVITLSMAVLLVVMIMSLTSRHTWPSVSGATKNGG
jgi:hypothetical protein